jgi:Fe-S-cluster-containing dehydrogenase component
MVIDKRRCIGCQSCTVACRTWNNLPMDIIYNPVVSEGVQGKWPNVHQTFTPLLCNHCQNPPCVICCPCKATFQDDDGIVWVDPNKCMGCKFCVQNCPYGARDVSAAPEEGFARKCTFCKDRVRTAELPPDQRPEGWKPEDALPYCVNTCHQKARIFGDLDDPDSEVSKLVNGNTTTRLFTELGTDPQVYYIEENGGSVK